VLEPPPVLLLPRPVADLFLAELLDRHRPSAPPRLISGPASVTPGAGRGPAPDSQRGPATGSFTLCSAPPDPGGRPQAPAPSQTPSPSPAAAPPRPAAS